MPDIKIDDKYGFFICGQCKTKIEYLIVDGKPDICPDCSYEAKQGAPIERSKTDVPSEVKLDLTQY